MDNTPEIIILKYIIENPRYYEVVKDYFFENNYLKIIYKICKKFYKKFQESPTREQLKYLIEKNKIDEFLDENKNYDFTIVNIIYDVNLNEYNLDWIKENFEAWVEWRNLNYSLFEAIEILKTSEVNTENVKIIVERVKEKFLNRNNLIFDFEAGMNIFDENSYFKEKIEYFTSGYEFLDKILGGGFSKKTLIILSAAPKGGKSLFLQNIAANIIRQGKNVLYITLELSEYFCAKRIASNLLNIEINQFDEIIKDKIEFKNRIKSFIKTLKMVKKITPGILIIKEFPTGMFTTIDLEQYLKKVQENLNLKFDLVIIDYLNIMKNWRNPNSENLYLKGKMLSEDLRAIAIRNECVIMTAVQLNREGVRSSNISMADISESMGVVHTADALFSILNKDYYDNINSKIRIKPLALRNAPNDDNIYTLNVDYKFMRIEEENDKKIIENLNLKNELL